MQSPTMSFQAPDGKTFESRIDYRRYMMERYLTFQNLTNGDHIKERGSINGNPFKITNVKGCTLVVPDHCDQVIIEQSYDCRIFIGASSGSIFLRHCQECTFTIACKQLRTRDCSNCRINLYCATEPAIESSFGMTFAPFNGAYPGHKEDMTFAKLPMTTNLWYAIYDFSAEHGDSKDHFEILPMDQWGDVWMPLGPTDLAIEREGRDKKIPMVSQNSTAPVDNLSEQYSYPYHKDLYEITYRLYLNLKGYAWSRFDTYKDQMTSTKLCVGLSILSAACLSMFWKMTRKNGGKKV